MLAPHIPVLWLFTDAARLADPRAAIAALPPHLCGVLFRHDGVPGRAALARAVARQCRGLGIPLVVAGDARLAAAAGAGVHLRGGRAPGVPVPAWRPGTRGRRRGTLVTSSAHSAAELRCAWTAGADAVFLSPAFPTCSHPGAPAFGAVRWAACAGRLPRGGRRAVLALGGVDGASVRRLPRWCEGAGAIGALMPGTEGDECVSADTVFRNCHKSLNPAIAADGQSGNSVIRSGCLRP